MRGMFRGVGDFTGQINGWDVSSVTDMQAMFGCMGPVVQSESEWLLKHQFGE